MPAINEATIKKLSTLKEIYGQRINPDNEFLIMLIAELQGEVEGIIKQAIKLAGAVETLAGEVDRLGDFTINLSSKADES